MKRFRATRPGYYAKRLVERGDVFLASDDFNGSWAEEVIETRPEPKQEETKQEETKQEETKQEETRQEESRGEENVI